MSDLCEAVHLAVWKLKRYSFPFDESAIPENGIYLLFEKGEFGHDGDRIVRVGTHTGRGKLVSRLREHFVTENKDRSVFRKNIGRALLNIRKDTFLKCWEYDLTTRRARSLYSGMIDFDYQTQIEKEVSEYIQNNFSFAVIEIDDKKDRLDKELAFVSIISSCNQCFASANWLGMFSTKDKIKKSGLWQEQGLFRELKVVGKYDYILDWITGCTGSE